MSQSPCVIPISTKVVSGKHYSYNCFSITLRDGSGINLGSLCHSEFLKWFNSEPQYAVLSIEKSENAAHYQAGVVMLSPIRQDVLRSKLMSFCESLNWNEKQRKHALKVVPHNDPKVLFRYCVKDSDPIVWRYPLTFQRARGCTCSAKYEICQYCDPHRLYWFNEIPSGNFRFKWFWFKVENEPTKFHYFLDMMDPSLCDIYGPLAPYVTIY